MVALAQAISHPQWHVEELVKGNTEVRILIQRIADCWQQRAKKLAVSCFSDKKNIYEASERVNRVVSQRTHRLENFKKTFRIAICCAKDNEIKAFALFKSIRVIQKIDTSQLRKRLFLHLNYLSSDPDNLNEESRIRGVGEALIQFLSKIAIQEGYEGIFVEPLPQARDYFKRKGFIPLARPGLRSFSMCLNLSDWIEKESREVSCKDFWSLVIKSKIIKEHS